MQRVTLSDFTGGMVQRISPDDYNKGEWGYIEGFVPENDRTLRSQWGIQSVGNNGPAAASGSDDNARNWLANGTTGAIDTSDVISIYPLRASSGVFLVAIKANGTVWWTKASASDAAFATTNACVWKKVGYDASDAKCYAVNPGHSIYQDYLNQPKIEIEANVDYRFICDLPFEVYKYIKEPQDRITVNTSPVTYVNGSHVVAANPPVADWTLDFTKDALPDTTFSVNDDGVDGQNAGQTGYPRSIVSAVLLHSRRYYRDGVLTTGKDYSTKRTITRYQVVESPAGVFTATIWFAAGTLPVLASGDDISVKGTNLSNIDGGYMVIGSGNDANGDYVTYFTKGPAVTAATNTSPSIFCFRKHRTQTAVVAYVDPYTDTVRAVTFPNFRRWPMYTGVSNQANLFKAEFRPMPTWGVSSARTQLMYPFIDRYPYPSGTIEAPMIQDQPLDATNWPDDSNFGAAGNYSVRPAFPRVTNAFHPYTYLNNDKAMLPGRGILPRAFAGTMFGSLLILGDVEWKEDSSAAYLTEKRLVPKKNHAVVPTSNSNFGLRDGNTEPHRGFFYYSQDDVDVFDPRSILRASGTDTRIAGMHTLNNRIISITTAGGSEDGIVSFSGNFGALHPYTPGVLANPLAVRKEVILGGVGTADTVDWYNHGNPQTCLWPEFGRVAFIDKSGYVYTTDGAGATILDERSPLIGKPAGSTVNDHVAAANKYLFVYKNGYLFCYTITNGRGAWFLLKRPEAWWTVRTSGIGYTRQYNVIRSMRGIANELYFVVHSYWLDCDSSYVPLPGAEPVLGASRVMRFAMNGPAAERGCQDGYKLDALDIITPVMGVVNQSKKVFWREVSANFYTETGAELIGAGTASSYPFDEQETIKYDVPGGVYQTPLPNMDSVYTPTYSTPLKTYTEGYHNFELSAGLGPQRILTARFSFRGDVTIEGVNIFFTGEYDLKGNA